MNETAEQILKLVGGKENISSLGHCITRLRITLKDKNKAQVEQIKQLDDVMNTQFQGGQLQIILGPEVTKYYNALIDLTGDINGADDKSPKEKVSLLNRIAGNLSGIFIPAIAAISAGGTLKAVLALLMAIGLVGVDSDTYTILNMLGDAPFYFLPVILGFSTASKIKTNPYLGASLGAVLVYPTLINGAAEGLSAFSFLGLPIPYGAYASTVLPVILAVIVLKYVYNFLNRIIPAVLEIAVTFALAFFVTSIIMLMVLAPAGNYLGIYLAKAFTWLFATAGPLAGMMMGGFFTVMVMTGLGYALMPMVFQNLSVLGYDFIFIPFMLYSNINQGVAALAASIKLKDKKQKSVAIGTGVTAIFGITEPAMYTVNLRYKKPFYSAMIGSATAGLLSSLFSVKAFVMAGGGITALPAFMSSEYKNNLLFMLLSLGVGMVITFVVSLVWTKESDLDEEIDVSKQKNAITLENGATLTLSSIGNGKMIDISEVPDSTFSEGIMGQGVAIDIQDGKIYAPFDGEVAAIFPTKHAIGLKSKEGIEVLIHIGVDTVRLGDDYFNGHVRNGDAVKKGQLLIDFDYNKLKETGVYTPTIVLVTNTNDFDKITVRNTEQFKTESALMDILV
ncbi:PTS beta-glucoside transporter subunit EIIBCA [Enterococcus florum]|uniref:PTS system sucrose-specific EIIBCA component n=1 Tax=Enterococcus florum TaxID=2480627 RepID=A0A4P5P9R4_9ENTE|nr:beta-glucoside-specific PTS transporter subunit IIABC [Enterococcus florum]GCF94660.1 PTS beta-glucoside transporter subunit EIIBCA [Enterococcus florum]